MLQFQTLKLSYRNKFARMFWNWVWLVLYRPSPILLHGWRRFLLRSFGATVGQGAHPYPSARIWAPWNLNMGAGSCLSHDVDCYNVEKIRLGTNVTVSQYSFLCTATKNYEYLDMPLVAAPIDIGDNAWIAADAFIGPGIVISEGAVVCARSTVTSNVPAWTVVAGAPAQFIRKRQIKF